MQGCRERSGRWADKRTEVSGRFAHERRASPLLWDSGVNTCHDLGYPESLPVTCAELQLPQVPALALRDAVLSFLRALQRLAPPVPEAGSHSAGVLPQAEQEAPG